MIEQLYGNITSARELQRKLRVWGAITGVEGEKKTLCKKMLRTVFTSSTPHCDRARAEPILEEATGIVRDREFEPAETHPNPSP